MTRLQIIAVSTVCCAFGAVAVRGPDDYRLPAYVVNVVLAIAAFCFAGRDLTDRGYRRGYLWAGAYVLPLIGTFVYIALSSRPKQAPVSA